MTEAATVLVARSNMTEASSASPSPERSLIEARLLPVVMAQKSQNNACRKKIALNHEIQRYQRHARKNVVSNNRHSRVRVYGLMDIVHLDRLQLHVSPPQGLRDV